MTYDVLIIGGGTAGLTAAIYALRFGKKVLIIEKNTFGGQIALSPRIENYPGIMQMSGMEFANVLVEQVIKYGAEVDLNNVLKITKNNNLFSIFTDNKTFYSKTIIIANGVKHRPLNIENEMSMVGEGISYCAVCDGPFFQNKDVVVVGGGNTAVQDAIFLSTYCNSVTIIQSMESLTADQVLQKSLKNKHNVRVLYNHVVDQIIGKNNVKGVIIKDTLNNQKKQLDVLGIFVAIGHIPDNQIYSDFIDLDENGYFVASEECLTKTPGLYVAGDCRTKTVRQLTTATADGTIAAINACKYIDQSF